MISTSPKDQNPGISLELLKDLWDSFVLNPLIPEEKDVLFGWLVKTFDPKNKIKIAIEDLIIFFNEKFKSYHVESVSKEAFECFREMFCIINEKQNKIIKLKHEEAGKTNTQNYHNRVNRHGNVRYSSQSHYNNYDDASDASDSTDDSCAQ